MSVLISTLPGDIPNLRRDGTVMRHAHYGRGVAFSDLRGRPIILAADGRCLAVLEGWEVDLLDPTGRVHTAWWALAEDRKKSPFGRSERERLLNLCDLAQAGREMTPQRIDEFARLCLRLAGRTP